MNKAFTVATALVAGLAGGLLTRYVIPPAAFAQDQAPITKEIRAQSFTLVDVFDRSIGTFTFEPTGNLRFPSQPAPGRPMPPMLPGRIVLRDYSGREIWSAGGSAVRPLSER